MYTKQEDIDIVKALEIENGSTVGPGLAGNSIWDKIYERCQDNENLRNRSASSLKFRFLQYIQPNLSVSEIIYPMRL